MRTTISLGRWFGVPIRLHFSWIIIAWLITVSLRWQLSAVNDSWSSASVWALSAITAALFFLCITLHELAHASVARSFGVPVHSITLFALGGIAQIEREAETPGREFWIAIAGPIASLALGVTCRMAASGAGLGSEAGAEPASAAVLGWLAYINVALAVFNLIPAFPLDGGRVLRAAVWAATRRQEQATRIAAGIGQAIAFLFIIGGLLTLFTRNDFGGLWIAFIGWFLLEGARAYYAQSAISSSLKGVRVGDVMTTDCAAIDSATTLDCFVSEHLLRQAARCYIVRAGQRAVGLITAEDVSRVDRNRWSELTVVEAMRPLEALQSVAPETAAGEALELMGRTHVNQLPVVIDGRMAGVITLAYLTRLLQVRRQLNA